MAYYSDGKYDQRLLIEFFTQSSITVVIQRLYCFLELLTLFIFFSRFLFLSLSESLSLSLFSLSLSLSLSLFLSSIFEFMIISKQRHNDVMAVLSIGSKRKCSYLL